MWADRFLDLIAAKLGEVRSKEAPAVTRAAQTLADTIGRGGLIYVFGCGHSAALAMDLFYRAGGFVLVHPIFDDRVILSHRPVTETTDWEQKEGWIGDVFQASGARAGDAIIIFSTSGRNPAPVDMALAAKEAGLTVIAITSLAYASSLPSRHSSGRRLHEAADIVIDNHVDPGDAALSLPGLPQKVGPTSTALNSALAQALMVEVTARLLESGITPPIYVSSNLPGGPEHNQQVLARYRDRIRFI